MREGHQGPRVIFWQEGGESWIWEEERIRLPIKTLLSGVNPQMQVAQAGMSIARAWVVLLFFSALPLKAVRSQGGGERLEPTHIPARQPVPCRAT